VTDGPQPRVLRTADGLALEAELARATGGPPLAAVVLCHPHPQYGGTMRSLVTSALFEALPAHGHTCLRFNFRGVGGSEGEWRGGRDEPLDVVAAVEALGAEVDPSLPVALTGWSFGADMALAVAPARIGGWVAVAPPLRTRPSFAAADDPRPKHFVLAEHDEVRAPGEVGAEVSSWPAATVEVVGGASHFFVGRTDRVVAAVDGFVARLRA
jgi:hypothetical protein